MQYCEEYVFATSHQVYGDFVNDKPEITHMNKDFHAFGSK